MSETKPRKSKLLCNGCYCDDYNHGLGGSKECWSYEDAEIKLRKQVHVDQVPPWKQKPNWYMSCYNKQRYVFVDGDQQQ